MKIAKSVTFDEDVLAAVETTKNGRSVSERVNELIRRGLKAEKYQQLAKEAAVFFSSADPDERAERKAYSRATRRALARNE